MGAVAKKAYHLIANADPYLMPLGVAHLLNDNGFRHPQATDSESNIALLTAVVEPAVHNEDDADLAAANYIENAGVTTS